MHSHWKLTKLTDALAVTSAGEEIRVCRMKVKGRNDSFQSAASLFRESGEYFTFPA